MNWDDRLAQAATNKAERRVRERRDRIAEAISAEAPFASVERTAEGLRVRATRLFRAMTERPTLRAALRGWA